MDTIKSVNGTVWAFAVILIGMVIIQSLLFLRLALNYNKKYQLLSKEEVSMATKTGGIAAIGPAFSTLVVALSLIAMVGSGATFMRCGVIGAPGWELMMSNISAQAIGVEFGSPEFTPAVFTLCLFGMTLASAPHFLMTIITLKPLDKAIVKEQKAKKKRNFTSYVSTSAMMGVLGYMTLYHLSAITTAAAFITAAVVSYLVSKLASKLKSTTLASFNMAIAMVCAMVVGQLVAVAIA